MEWLSCLSWNGPLREVKPFFGMKWRECPTSDHNVMDLYWNEAWPVKAKWLYALSGRAINWPDSTWRATTAAIKGKGSGAAIVYRVNGAPPYMGSGSNLYWNRTTEGTDEGPKEVEWLYTLSDHWRSGLISLGCSRLDMEERQDGLQRYRLL